jgi:hypothetical protein
VVAKVLEREGGINLTFRRNSPEILEWDELEDAFLKEIHLNNEKDTIRPPVTTHGQFTTALYKHYAFSGVGQRSPGAAS